MATQFDLAQSFFIDKGAVEDASTVHLTSIDLYFADKPDAGMSETGIYKPGISLYICPIENEQPVLDKAVRTSRARVEWDDITTSTDASTSTKFTFDRPIVVATDAQYAFLLAFDGSDAAFQLWWGETGSSFIDTTVQASINSGFNDGNFYRITNGSVLTKTTNADLKFKVNIAKFSSLTQSYKYKEKEYEIFEYYPENLSGDFIVGEYVYKNTSAQSGTLNISANSTNVTGTSTTLSTTFGAGDYIVITDGTAGNTVIRVISSSTNATHAVLDEKPHFTNSAATYYKTPVAKVHLYDKKSDHMVLVDTTAANATFCFANNDWIKSEDSQKQVRIKYLKDLAVNRITSQFNVVVPGFTSFENKINFANSVYYTNINNEISVPTSKREFVDKYSAILPSRSLALTNSNTSLWTGDYGVSGNISFTSTNRYCSPYVEEEDTDVYLYRYLINNDATNEETSYGNSNSRYISKKVVLGEGQDAEDLRVYLTMYQPQDTSVKVYGRFLNSLDYEPLDSKNWTLLEEVNPQVFYSSDSNKSDVIEREYRIPFYHSDGTDLSGYASITVPNTVISTSADLSGTVNSTSNSVVRVYNTASPNNFFISYVVSSTASSITVAESITNTSFNAAGLKVELVSNTNKHSAFINPQNRNVVRYFTKGYAPMDTYKVFLIKIVLLSPDTFRVPYIKDVRAIAVSA